MDFINERKIVVATKKKTSTKTKSRKKELGKIESITIKKSTLAMSGANCIEIENHVGRPAGEVRDAFTTVLNISTAAKIRINGKEAKPTRVIKQGDQVEFVVEAGTKGC